MNRIFTVPIEDLRVIDGDSLDLLLDLGFSVRIQRKCRLNGIDAPERSTEAGQLVADVVKRALVGFAKVEWSSHRIDKYGRSLGDLITDGKPFSAFLLDNGFVKSYHGETKRVWSPDELADVVTKCRLYLAVTP